MAKSTLAALLGLADTAPLPRYTTADPAGQAVLDRAAAGDPTAGPLVAAVLATDTALRRRLGGLAGQAERALIRRVAGADAVHAAALQATAADQFDRLAGPDSGLVERMLARRVVNNWLTVHGLELLTANEPADGRAAVALARQLTLAERRLTTALRALAAVRKAAGKTPDGGLPPRRLAAGVLQDHDPARTTP